MRGTLFLPLVLIAACGSSSSGPYNDLPVVETIDEGGLSAPADAIRDRFGVVHINAKTVADAAFAQGYFMALDRIQQMDLFRHFASGTVSELFGALDRGQIDADLEMRMHRFRPLAEETWALLAASSDPVDIEAVTVLTRFSDGVNRLNADLQKGVRSLDSSVEVWFDAERFVDWTPVDTLVIGRLQAWLLSYGDYELSDTNIRDRARSAFDNADAGAQPDRARRAGLAADFLPLLPMDITSTVPTWPASASAPSPRPKTHAPTPPADLLANAIKTLMPKSIRGENVLRDPDNGSNNWVIGPSLADGFTLMANDPHLTLSNPSIFYATHLTVPGDLDVAGITFPGIPGVILGHNEHLAWGATTANHDVTDFYLEEIRPCTAGGGDCALWKGTEVPLETWEETIGIGALGTATETMTVTYERVPHHGPIIPTIENHKLAPRTGTQAISVRYTGYEPTFELRAFQKLWRAETVEQGIAAFDDFGFGAQNFVFADTAGGIGWTTNAHVPLRTEGCFGYHPTMAPEGVAPFFVVPGDGSCEWDGYMDKANIPHAINPSAGFLVTANADPIGASADGDPLNGPMVEGHRLYIGARGYAEGLRAERITTRLEQRIAMSTPLSSDDMGAIQADTYSNVGSRMTPSLLATLSAYLEEKATPGIHPSLSAYVAALTPTQHAALAVANTVLGDWTFETPAAMGETSAEERNDSAATSLFNAYMVYLIADALGDEAGVLGYGPGTFLTNTVYAAFTRPASLVTGLAAETNEALLCDDLDTVGTIESCTRISLGALVKALTWAASGVGFGSTDPADWRWGDKHRLTLETMLPATELNLPSPEEPDPMLQGGYPRHGDAYSVDASSPGYSDLDFTYTHGPAMRHVTELRPGQAPRTWLAIPGGQSFDRWTPHYRDLMDTYWSKNEYFEFAWTTASIIEVAEGRYVIR